MVKNAAHVMLFYCRVYRQAYAVGYLVDMAVAYLVAPHCCNRHIKILNGTKCHGSLHDLNTMRYLLQPQCTLFRLL